MSVTIRFWAAAREAAGEAEQSYDGVDTLAELLAAALAARGDDGGRLERVLSRCSYIVDGDPVGRRDRATVAVPPGSVVEALPPFAGGSRRSDWHCAGGCPRSDRPCAGG